MNLGNQILRLRKDKGFTQEELAQELGVTAAAVSKWEKGYTLPDVLMLCALADCFGVTTDALLGRNEKVRYAVIAAESEQLGKKAAELAREYGVAARSIHTDFEAAKTAALADDTVEYLVACFFRGFYGDCPGRVNLVSVAPTEDKVLEGLRQVFEKYLED